MEYKFKVGDRVIYYDDDNDVRDTGTITEVYTSNYYKDDPRYWVLWDSSNTIEHTSEDTLTHEIKQAHEVKDVTQLLKSAAVLSLENGDYTLAAKILKLIQGE
jgi:hypothetical protein